MLALLFCTTHLHYTQNMMENNYIMLLTLIGFSYPVRVAAHAEAHAPLFLGSARSDLNLLTRVTPDIDLIAAGDLSAGRALVRAGARARHCGGGL